MATLKLGRTAELVSVFAVAAIGCASIGTASAAMRADVASAVYVADLKARITVRSDTLTITIHVKCAPPSIEHWQHFDGFKNGCVAACSTAAADVNHDGAVDLIETEALSGTTIAPFNGAPAAMQIPIETCPKASPEGSYSHETTISSSPLQAAFAKAFNGQRLDLDRRDIFIHGVPASAKLAASAAFLGLIPASVTLPIACGRIERAAKRWAWVQVRSLSCPAVMRW